MSRKPKKKSRSKAPLEQQGARDAELKAERARAVLEERERYSKPAKNERWKLVGICVVLAALVWAVFGQTLHHEFVNFDDNENVYEIPAVTGGLTLHGLTCAFTHTQAGRWAPLAVASRMLDCQLYGLQAGGHLLTNLLLHATAAILLFLLFRQMTGALWRSAFVAGCFAIHPLKVEAVAWVSGRGDLLSGIFFMLALWAYARSARRPESRRSVAWVALWLALGLMGKSMLMTVPFVLLLLDYWPLGRLQNRSQLPGLIREKWPLFFLSAFSCAATLMAQKAVFDRPMDRFALPLRMGNALVAYCVYLGKMVYPADLAVYYPFLLNGWPAWEVVAAILLLGILTAGVFVLRRKQPFLVVGWLWYLGMLVPVIGILQIGEQAFADRYTYLPQIGLYVGVTWAVADWSKEWRYRRWILSVLSGCVIMALIACARIQTAYWRNSESLWTHALACTKRNAIAHNNLGTALLQRGLIEEAIIQYREAVRINPAYSGAHYNLGAALLQRGQAEEAIAQYREAVRINPAYSEAHNNLGNALFQKGQAEEAIAQYREAVRINPDYLEAMNNLAYSLATAGDGRLRNGGEALVIAQRANDLNKGGSPIILGTLAAVYAETGRFGEAEEMVRRAIGLAKAQSNPALTGTLQEHLKLYQARRPLRIGPGF